ncbi:MAG: hypothetical protein LUC93_11595 [Planctomycetaceae bacterium]|nr:hypothetical protein [Planctomycetaceae bacterium]
MKRRIHLTVALATILVGSAAFAADSIIDNRDVRRGAEDIGRVAAEARDTGLDIADQAVDLAEEVSDAFKDGYRDAQRRP